MATCPFAELSALVDQGVWTNRTGPSGAEYAIHVYGLWDSGVVGGNLRIVADALDGTKTRLRFLRSAGTDFLVTPTGDFLH